MQQGDIKIFTKSGNRVELIKGTGSAEWRVERVDGTSKGKQMICRETALVDPADFDEDKRDEGERP